MMEFMIPKSLKLEHEELYAQLVRATKAGGQVAEAAKVVVKALHPHFVKEEEYALPPLGLLPALAEGQVPPGVGDFLKMTNSLKANLGQMLQEHKVIVSTLKDLVDASKKENQMIYVRFAEKLTQHAQTEEEVLYPAAILIGEYLKLKSGK
jgi:iron-sulfur cluster repair protein YtfE (RIC family)